MSHRGDSVNPRSADLGVAEPLLGQMGVVSATPTYFLFKKKSKYIKKKKFKKILGSRVAILMVPHVADVKIRQF
jgi:hypothetical protein